MTSVLIQRAALITVSFFFTSGLNVYPQRTSPAAETVAGVSGESNLAQIQKELVRPGTPLVRPDLNPYLITVPAEYGNIEEVYQGAPDAPLIVHIQNVHANYKAQLNIKNILDHLVGKHQFSLIQIEGAVAKVDPEILKPSYLEEANLKLADLLLREGRITGAHAFAIETDRPVELYGIEDFGLYTENLKIFKAIYAHREEVNAYFSNAHRMVNRIGRTLLTPGALDFTRKKESFSRDEIGLLDYLVYLNQVAERSGLTKLRDLKEMIRYPNLVRILRIHELEERLDRTELEKEGKRLRSEFSKKLPQAEAAQELLGRLEAREKGVRPRAYFVELTKLADQAGIDFVGYPQIRLFAESLIYQDEIDHRGVFPELKRYEADLEKALFKTEDEQAILEIISFVSLLEQFFRLEMSREKLAIYVQDRDKMKPSWIQTRLAGLAEEQSTAYTPLGAVEQLDAYMSELEDFYRLVLKRDEFFIEKILAKMNALGENKTVVITGGFHKDPLVDEFRRQEVSYVVVSPGVDITEGSENYVKVMLDEDSVAGTVFAGTFAVEVADLGIPGREDVLSNIFGAADLLQAHLAPTGVPEVEITNRSRERFRSLVQRSRVWYEPRKVERNDYAVRVRAEARFFNAKGEPILHEVESRFDRSDLRFTVRTVRERKISPAELRNIGITEPPMPEPIRRDALTALSRETLRVDRGVPTAQRSQLTPAELSTSENFPVGTFVSPNVPVVPEVEARLLERLFSLTALATKGVVDQLRSGGVLTLEGVERASRETGLAGPITPTDIQNIAQLSEGEKRLFMALDGTAPQAPLFLVLPVDTVNQSHASRAALLSLVGRIRANDRTAAAVYGVNVKNFALSLGISADEFDRIFFVDQDKGIELSTFEGAVDLVAAHVQSKHGLWLNHWLESVPGATRMSIDQFMNHLAILVPAGEIGNRLSETTAQRWQEALQVIELDLSEPGIVRDQELQRAVGDFLVKVLVNLRNAEAVALLYELSEGAIKQVARNLWQISGTPTVLNLILNLYRAEVQIQAAA